MNRLNVDYLTLDDFLCAAHDAVHSFDPLPLQPPLQILGYALGSGHLLDDKLASTNSLTIQGTGRLTANANSHYTGISGNGNTSTDGSAGGTIIIEGGTVEATGGDYSAGIGGGSTSGSGGGGNGDEGAFRTNSGGSAFIMATGGSRAAPIVISDDSQKTSWSGVIFEGNAGRIYGTPTLGMAAAIPAGKTLTVGDNQTLDIGASLNNSGLILLASSGTISGTVTNEPGGVIQYIVPNPGEGYTVNYIDETIAAETGYEVSSSNSGSAAVTGPILGTALYVRHTAKTIHSLQVSASDWTENTIPARPGAPAALQWENATAADRSDGKITGVSPDME